MDGPEFLYQDLSYWPAEPSDIFNKSKTDEISNLSVVVNVNPTKFSTENSEVKEALETNSLNMRNAHKRTLHAGVKETLCQIRSKYWILRGRKLVRSLINKCSFCKRSYGKAFTSKVSPPLPHYRVTASFPFQHTGVDYLGPLHVKPIFDDNSTKMYPVHNEEVKLSEELLLLGIDWKYIIEAAPWWGCFWERLVQSVKKSLLKVVFRSSIRYDELETILCEIEGLLNSRPITYAYHEDTEEVFTPSHLMHGRRLISPNETKGADLDKLESKIQLTKRMKYLKLIRDHFWVRFTSEYLVNLREFHKQGSSKSRSIELGEIVVIHSDIKRYKWRLGKVVSLITGSDNIVRSAIVKVLTDKTIKQNYIKRPIEKLYPIEVKSVETVTDTELNASNDAVDESNDFSDTKYERPVRIASRNGILIRRLMGQF
ncbi:uncharacterized protein LOC124806270 [Hydra vulgaris]|uniref:uncharacterized protein LOC124806270 n=1 Tax=Hydra vulgaris TaxID=6087 RepID=UPI001F5FCBD0|nr:uncharacterized protein LOC124806270 [Hydra vulgaris]